MKEPDKLLLRKKDVCLWTGISSKEYDDFLDAEVIRGVKFKKNGRLYFYKEHIFEALIKPAMQAAGLKRI